jgi:hypothetical protein
MRKLAFFGYILFFVINFSLAQSKEYSCIIDRKDFKNIVIKSDNGETYQLSNDSLNQNLNNNKFKLVKGKGNKKDKNGIKENSKIYLIKNDNDTMSSIINEEICIKNQKFIRTITKNGWNFININGDTICEMNLLWNNNFWNYDIKFSKIDSSTIILEKILFLSMVDLAHERSKSIDKQQDDDYFNTNNIWFVLWILGQN